MKKKLSTQVIPIHSATQKLLDTMYALYASYYDAGSKVQFENDLKQKTCILLMFDSVQQLRGFTTVSVSKADFSAQPVQVIFSGDTIIHHEFWGEQTLPLAWCHLVGQIKAASPTLPLYWFLIVKGHRTYRYLNVFSKTYYPNRKYPTPELTQNFMHMLAQEKFGNAYRTDTGTVQYAQSQGHLKPEWANEKIKRNPEAAFFYEKNPHYEQGSELVCLTELTEDNLRSFALRGFQQGFADGKLVFD